VVVSQSIVQKASFKLKKQSKWIAAIAQPDQGLLLIWIAVGALLRFAHLTAKPPWTDEFATMVFSLGNDFQTIPINQTLSIAKLLEPLQINPQASVGQVVSFILSEDNHPPLYFVLAYFWQKFWFSGGQYLDLALARSLSAGFGVLSIPAIYVLGCVAWRSRWVGHWAAILMAVSPYGVFLAQDARHYTFVILWVIASLICLAKATQSLWQIRPLPGAWVIAWILANGLGFSSHYFFGITLLAEGCVLAGLFGVQWRQLSPQLPHQPSRQCLSKAWRSVLWVGLGTSATVASWLNISLASGYGNNMTSWLQIYYTFVSLISPIFQLLAAWITMISLLPIESSFLPVVLASGFLMLLFFIWATPIVLWCLKRSYRNPLTRFPTAIFGGFIASAIAIFFLITYILGKDITKGARYSFTYFPAVILLLGAALAICWQEITPQTAILPKANFLSRHLSAKWREQGRWIAVAIALMGLVSSWGVISNLGYQKYYTADRLVPIIAENSTAPVLIATTHQSLVQTGEMMGIAWELRKTPLAVPTHFLLAHQAKEGDRQAIQVLKQQIAQLPRPLDLWAVNFQAKIEFNGEQQGCKLVHQPFPYINGYSYQLYRCR
jgi:uncharacterized membrane protein